MRYFRTVRFVWKMPDQGTGYVRFRGAGSRWVRSSFTLADLVASEIREIPAEEGEP